MDRRIERTKRNIYLAFFELHKKKAIDEISVTELAKLADIDRRTFYMHYATVTDVYLEFMQQLQDTLADLLLECEARGEEQGELFDFTLFYRELQAIMEEHLPFYEKLSKDKASMFLLYDCKDILEAAMREFYGNHFPGTPQEETVYLSWMSNGITGLGADFLTRNPNMTYEEYCSASVPLLKKAWLPRK